VVAPAEEQQVVETLNFLEPDAGASPGGSVAVCLSLDVVSDQPRGPFRDRPLQRPELGRVDGLADVMQRGRELGFDVMGSLIPRQLEDRQAVIERLPLRVTPGALLATF
jgi:hypothetical protein